MFNLNCINKNKLEKAIINDVMEGLEEPTEVKLNIQEIDVLTKVLFNVYNMFAVKQEHGFKYTAEMENFIDDIGNLYDKLNNAM